MKPFPLNISFYQEDHDTFKSTITSVMFPAQKEDFFKLLEQEGIDCNAHTRPREVPTEDRERWDHYHEQAAFIGHGGRIVVDISVINKLKEKYTMNITEAPSSPKLPGFNILSSIKKRFLPSRHPG